MISLKQSVEYSKWLVLIIVGASFLAWQTNVSWKHLLYFLVTIALMICAFVFLESQNRGETIDKPTNDLAESMRSNPYTRRLGSNAQESKKTAPPETATHGAANHSLKSIYRTNYTEQDEASMVKDRHNNTSASLVTLDNYRAHQKKESIVRSGLADYYIDNSSRAHEVSELNDQFNLKVDPEEDESTEKKDWNVFSLTTGKKKSQQEQGTPSFTFNIPLEKTFSFGGGRAQTLHGNEDISVQIENNRGLQTDSSLGLDNLSTMQAAAKQLADVVVSTGFMTIEEFTKNRRIDAADFKEYQKYRQPEAAEAVQQHKQKPVQQQEVIASPKTPAGIFSKPSTTAGAAQGHSPQSPSKKQSFNLIPSSKSPLLASIPEVKNENQDESMFSTKPPVTSPDPLSRYVGSTQPVPAPQQVQSGQKDTTSMFSEPLSTTQTFTAQAPTPATAPTPASPRPPQQPPQPHQPHQSASSVSTLSNLTPNKTLFLNLMKYVEDHPVDSSKKEEIKDEVSQFHSQICSKVDDHFLSQTNKLIEGLNARRNNDAEYILYCKELLSTYIVKAVEQFDANKVKIVSN
jgi:hypothetical protein